jgi:integrase/recombinase XerD
MQFFMTVVRLGLRVSDIRALKLSNLNWNLKNISIIMQKTKQPLELPILEDVGWAIIDYLKNGRPETSSDILFIRHRALHTMPSAKTIAYSIPYIDIWAKQE